MKTLYLSAFIIFYSITSFSQHAKEFMISGHGDFIKTDNKGLFKKSQFSFELNYFLTRKFSISLGHEDHFFKNGADFGSSIGGRFYPVLNFFFRLRGIALPGSYDFSPGIGWSKPLRKKWRVEFIADYYHDTDDFALKGGIAYIINPKE